MSWGQTLALHDRYKILVETGLPHLCCIKVTHPHLGPQPQQLHVSPVDSGAEKLRVGFQSSQWEGSLSCTLLESHVSMVLD